MVVNDVQLLSRMWGMSCYAVKPNTQQPTQLPPHNASFFLSLLHSEITCFSFRLSLPLDYKSCLHLCSLGPAPVKTPITTSSPCFTAEITPVPWQISAAPLTYHALRVYSSSQKSAHTKRKTVHMTFECSMQRKTKYMMHLHVFTGVAW